MGAALRVRRAVMNGVRLVVGPPVRRLRREAQWWSVRGELASERNPQPLSFVVAEHATPLIRELPGVDLALQRNKVVNLRLAAGRLDGIVLAPGERLSFWRLVGPPVARRGFLPGLVLRAGRPDVGVGGGLCQMTNLIFWMTLHTPLQVVERWRHSYDVFPDTGRTQPFGSGATCAWPALDLQIVNPTDASYRLGVRVGDTQLHGSWTSDEEPLVSYRVEERAHEFRHDPVLGFVRHNELWQLAEGAGGQRERLAVTNDAVLMYQPFLSSATQGPDSGCS